MLRKFKGVQRRCVRGGDLKETGEGACCGDLKESERVSVLRRFKGVQSGFVCCGDLKESREGLCVAET